MLTGIHFLLSYMCNAECDHCFVYSGPNAQGTFTLAQIQQVLKEAQKIGSIEMVYFEGGEPFLFYPVMLEGARIAKKSGFKVSVVTNSYFATSVEDAQLWFMPLAEIGIEELSISDDTYHFEDEHNNPAKIALEAARRLGLPLSTITIESPTVKPDAAKGEPVIGGGTVLRGRAAERLTEDLPRKPWQTLDECLLEELRDPKRVHVDAYGNVHLCQGLSMGNMWKTPLSCLVKTYNAEKHPICRALLQGGPARLAQEYRLEHEESYVDACHFCFLLRKALLSAFPEYLAPKQVYGVE
jgi:hypothetical protein